MLPGLEMCTRAREQHVCLYFEFNDAECPCSGKRAIKSMTSRLGFPPQDNQTPDFPIPCLQAVLDF